DELAAAPEPSDITLQIAADNLVMSDDLVRGRRGDADFEVMSGLRGFRLNAPTSLGVALTVNGEPRRIELTEPADAHLDADWEGAQQYISADGTITAFDEGAAFAIALQRAEAGGAASAADGAILAPMPGKVIAV